nr:uncharacterized protein LOC115270337 [Aedes albopictus]
MRTKEDEVLHEVLQHELQEDFVQARSELREAAHQSIKQIQDENKKYYNLRRKPSRKYQLGDVVAIPKTQFGVGQKVKQKYFGPYEIVGVWPNDRYEVQKLDPDGEGPNKTSTSGDSVKPWSLPGRK